MFYVYFLISLTNPQKTYIGFTTNHPTERLSGHNAGDTAYTKKHKPWQLASYIAFQTEAQARRYEVYAKSGSGKAYINKHFLTP
ncbi:MAG: GIY-YIG nuclease family protein [Proteobacteria bacterium]|nr:GIY-YIG nuclease family protein [Pseudomonadota bacterium]